MARKTITQAQRGAIKSGVLDLLGDDKAVFDRPVKLTEIEDTLAYLGQKYVDEIRAAIDKKDVVSSGKGADSVQALEVEVFGTVYSVSIEANKYLSYVSGGVDGWAKSRGGEYSFKTKGVDPAGPMVKSVKAWLLREGKISRNMKYKPITKRERKQQQIKDVTDRQAISTAFMIKRQGIKPRKFFDVAKRNMEKIVENEFAAALKVDIINNLT